MPWPLVAHVAQDLPLPPGALVRAIRTTEVPALTKAISLWYPRVRVGSESVFLDADFFTDKVCLDERIDKTIWAAVLELDGHLRGIVSFEREPAAGVLHARLGVLDPACRSGMLGTLGIAIFERLGRACGAELLLQRVTLASKHQQVIAERYGFTLCGIIPGVDPTNAGSGDLSMVLRESEAIYSKLLGDPAKTEPLVARSLTRQTLVLARALDLPVVDDVR
jgi:hypothetical protein